MDHDTCSAAIAPEEPAQHSTLCLDDFAMDSARRTVWRAGQPIKLTPREFELLHFLVQHRGQVVRRRLIQEVFYDAGPEDMSRVDMSNVVDVYINFLRKKIDRGFGKPLILTRRGEGYMFRAD